MVYGGGAVFAPPLCCGWGCLVGRALWLCRPSGACPRRPVPHSLRSGLLSVAPPGLVQGRPVPHSLRSGLLSVAPPGLVPVSLPGLRCSPAGRTHGSIGANLRLCTGPLLLDLGIKRGNALYLATECG